MIQFNLLPDVKIQYIKVRQTKRRVIAISVITVIASLVLLGVMVSAYVFEKHHISDLNTSINTYETGLKNTKDLSKILTIQNQLNTLPQIYAGRPVTSRLFGYVQSTTPTQITMSSLNLDFDSSTLSVIGNADTLESINQYVDTLKFTTYTATPTAGGTPSAKTNAFSQVVLASFNRDQKQASFTITMNFDKLIFDGSQSIKLDVPKTITTRSETELPGAVFDTKGAQ